MTNLNYLNEEDSILIKKAYDLTSQNVSKSNNAKYINEIVKILTEFKADTNTLVSCILLGLINNETYNEEIRKEFGDEVYNICLGAYNLLQFKNIKEHINSLNKGSEEDVRILFIMLADRINTLRTEKKANKNIAKEALEILVPKAQEFKLNFIKSKLEDLCLYHLNPDIYNNILNNLGTSLENLSIFLNNQKEYISKLLKDNNINFIIKGRVKNIYSIYTKLESGKTWEDIYDILALRIIVEEESDCMKAIELIHSNYIYLIERFKDYITNPKENMYQSLHTTIIGENNRFYEIQIRTN